MVVRTLSEAHTPRLFAVPGGVLSLSGPALQEFLGAVLVKGVPFRFMARGSSMYPFLKDGDVITVEPFRAPEGGRLDLVTGDIVAFCHPGTGRLVVHRVIARRLGAVTVRGDNCTAPDGDIEEGALLGRVSRVERDGRPVALGRGPEKFFIAYLAKHDALIALVAGARRFARPFVLRFRVWRHRRSA